MKSELRLPWLEKVGAVFYHAKKINKNVIFLCANLRTSIILINFVASKQNK